MKTHCFNIYKRKDGRYEGRIPSGRSQGRTRYLYVYAKTYEEAGEKLRLLEMEVRPGTGQGTGRPDGGFTRIANEWLKARSPRLKPSTAAKYRQVLDSHLLPAFGHREIAEVTQAEAAAFFEGLPEKGLSSGTTENILSVAKNLFSWASREKGLRLADLRGISVRKEHREMDIFSRKEQETLTRYLKDDASPCALGVLLSLYTGLRIGELCGVRWEDISRQERTLHVHRTVLRVRAPGEKKTQVVVSTPKSPCSVRRIPIPEEICLLLDEHRRDGDAWLMTGRAGRCKEPRAVQYAFKKLLADCGVRETNFHTLRHTFATRCVELGFDAKTLSVILGHAKVGITMDRYVHPTMEMKKNNMDKLSALI